MNQEQNRKEFKKKIYVMAVVFLLFIGVIAIIFLRSSEEEECNSKEITCIANKSILIVSKSCGHCADQKKILGEYLNCFEIIDISEHPEVIIAYNIIGVPTWIINGETYAGVRQLKELKNITKC